MISCVYRMCDSNMSVGLHVLCLIVPAENAKSYLNSLHMFLPYFARFFQLNKLYLMNN